MKALLKMYRGTGWGLAALLIVTMIFSTTAGAAETKSAAKFYKGKTIRWYVPAKAGGGYDSTTRTLAPYIQQYTGARNVEVINKPGGGMMLAPTYVYSATKPDGLSLCIVHTLSACVAQLIGKAGMEKIDITKFNWLGSVAFSPIVLYINSKLPYDSLVELKEAKGLKFGLTGPTGTPALVCTQILESVLNMKEVKPILGIESSPEVTLAVVRGEYDGSALPLRTIQKYLQNGSVRALAVLMKKRVQGSPDIPTIYEALADMKMTRDEKFWIDKVVAMCEFYRTVVTTPGVPEDRVAFLREAFEKSFQEKEMLAQGEKAKLDLEYVPSGEVAEVISSFMEISPERKAKFKESLKF